MSTACYEHVAAHGGMITCGDYLGVMVGTDPLACPRGWCFIPLDIATPELIAQCVAQVGRARWPKNQKRKPKNHDEMLEQVFDSQDYL